MVFEQLHINYLVYLLFGKPLGINFAHKERVPPKQSVPRKQFQEALAGLLCAFWSRVSRNQALKLEVMRDRCTANLKYPLVKVMLRGP